MENNITILETKERVTANNDLEAEKTRVMMKEKKVFFINLMGSPGSGKTTTLVRTINALKHKYRFGVMEADVDHDIDAKTVSEAGAKAIQLHTGGLCHMDADMTRRGLDGLGLEDVDVVFLENVGNLVCPAEFDVGSNIRVMILSVPEGDDKPLKYPLMFKVSDCMLINKIDVAPVFDFDFEVCKKRAKDLHPEIEIFPLSSKNGKGFESWINWLDEKIETWRAE